MVIRYGKYIEGRDGVDEQCDEAELGDREREKGGERGDRFGLGLWREEEGSKRGGKKVTCRNKSWVADQEKED